jgi:hypothetical protein
MINYKLWNHWIAEVREIALGKILHADGTDVMTKSDIRYLFNKALMGDYFKDGLSPQQAFDEEVSTWDCY